MLVLDLEDAVAPRSKDQARSCLATAISRLRERGMITYVRVNHDANLALDIDSAVRGGADGIVFPKLESTAALRRVEQLIEMSEAHAGRLGGEVKIFALLETPLALSVINELLSDAPRLVAAGFGSEDFATAMGIETTATALAMPLQMLAIAAVAAGKFPVGLAGSVGEFSDLNAFRRAAQLAADLGMRASVCIHPAQVAILNEVFGATTAQLVEAREIVVAYDAALGVGAGACTWNGKMIDAPIAARARALLRRQPQPRERMK